VSKDAVVLLPVRIGAVLDLVVVVLEQAEALVKLKKIRTH
jgi:hypothetical protein